MSREPAICNSNIAGANGVYDLHIKFPAEMLLVSTNRLKPLL